MEQRQIVAEKELPNNDREYWGVIDGDGDIILVLGDSYRANEHINLNLSESDDDQEMFNYYKKCVVRRLLVIEKNVTVLNING
jgi:hypothetical protein